MARARNRWGWGFQDAVIGAAEARAAAPGVVEALGFGSTEVEEPLPTPALPAPRVAVPRALAAICSADDRDRACHSLGKSYVDTVRALPRAATSTSSTSSSARADEADVEAALEWAAGANVAVIPYGGGTSVVGGVEPRIPAHVRRRGVARPRRARPGARGRPGLARRAHRRRRRRARGWRSSSARTG